MKGQFASFYLVDDASPTNPERERETKRDRESEIERERESERARKRDRERERERERKRECTHWGRAGHTPNNLKCASMGGLAVHVHVS